ncbi:hypothetical protein [Pseudomonas rubra]|uniref:Lipoprotein n=1 Tax=Pseudomonas rubra TaxID=2942627 RepID=A0ABT5PAZ4_9PSED|nr:hypothetical protein [Pseudomonas rubra]MDD1015480.1 hypothetical protein [Pseudomonas rubra]MDD1041294.1 hypothetical protein [Pseudomonas rubra]MDD1157131.1 hypothetical protein [Pseudomonas rubra]
MDALARFALKPLAAGLGVLTLAACSLIPAGGEANPPGDGLLPQHPRQAPDWRALNLDEDQDWLLIELNSLQHEGGITYAWTGIQRQRYPMKYGQAVMALHSRERLAFYCERQLISRQSQYFLDNDNHVDSTRLKAQSFSAFYRQAPLYYQRLFDAACQPPAELAKLAPLKARTPLPPPFLPPRATPEVLAAIAALDLPAPRLTLHRLDYRIDAKPTGGDATVDRPRQVFFSNDTRSGQLLLQAVDPTIAQQLQLSFRGLFDLAARGIDIMTGQEQDASDSLTALSFTGDWQTLPAHTQLSYTLSYAGQTASITRTTHCQVGKARPASTLHPALQGSAKPLSCTWLSARGNPWVEGYSYLDDYGVFVRTREDNPMGTWRWKIESLQ